MVFGRRGGEAVTGISQSVLAAGQMHGSVLLSPGPYTDSTDGGGLAITWTFPEIVAIAVGYGTITSKTWSIINATGATWSLDFAPDADNQIVRATNVPWLSTATATVKCVVVYNGTAYVLTAALSITNEP